MYKSMLTSLGQHQSFTRRAYSIHMVEPVAESGHLRQPWTAFFSLCQSCSHASRKKFTEADFLSAHVIVIDSILSLLIINIVIIIISYFLLCNVKLIEKNNIVNLQMLFRLS